MNTPKSHKQKLAEARAARVAAALRANLRRRKQAGRKSKAQEKPRLDSGDVNEG